jgi:group I intron endonuclease
VLKTIVLDHRPVCYIYPFTKRLTPQSAGIYKITCSTNGKFYIGSTGNFYNRRQRHVWHMRYGTHYNLKMQRTFNKYGLESLIFEVLETCSGDNVKAREQYWIDAYKPELNIALSAERPSLGLKRSPETIAKMSASQKGRPKSSEQRAAQVGRHMLSQAPKALRFHGIQTRNCSQAQTLRITQSGIPASWDSAQRKGVEVVRKRCEDRRSRGIVSAKHPLLNDRAWLCAQYNEKGLSTTQIGLVIGACSSLVHRAMKIHGIPTRNVGEAIHVYFADKVASRIKDAQWLREQYVEKQLSAAEIAAMLGGTTGATSVVRALKRCGIKNRSRSDVVRLTYARKRAAQLSLFPTP